jgi:hypothetical protein
MDSTKVRFCGVSAAALVAAVATAGVVLPGAAQGSVVPTADYYLPFENPPGSPTGTPTVENFGTIGGTAGIIDTTSDGGANFSYSSNTPDGSADSGYFAEAQGETNYPSATLAMPNASGGTTSPWGDSFSLDNNGGAGDQQMTVDAWVKLPSNKSNVLIAYKGNSRSNQPGWLLQATAGSPLQFNGYDVNGQTQLNGSIVLNAGVWTNVAVVVTVGASPSLEFYVNGVANMGGSSPMETLATDPTDPLMVGGGGAYMDNVRIWGTALTAAQIADISQVPEPTGISLVVGLAAGVLLLRRGRPVA